jgi:hypothetical protein
VVCCLCALLALWLALGLDLDVMRNRLDYWASAWKMISDHPWLGVGTGNFARIYPLHIQPGAYEPIVEPHNFILEVWATYGLFTLIAIVFSLGAFFWMTLRRVGPAMPDAPRESPAQPDLQSRPPQPEVPESKPITQPEPTRWEFYLGGMVGLLLGYLLRHSGQSADDALTQDPVFSTPALAVWLGIVAAVRSVIWFASYALIEEVRWPGRLLPGSLAVGVAALLLYLCFWGGISFPNVALFLWLAVGLALAALRRPAHQPGESILALSFPLVLAIGLVLAHVSYLFYPVSHAASLAHSASRAGRAYLAQLEREPEKLIDARKYLIERVVGPLRKGTEEDPRNARWQLHLATWYGEMWSASLRVGDRERARLYRRAGVTAASKAQEVDPQGAEGYQIEYRLHRRFAKAMQLPKDRKEQFALAAEALRKSIKNDPNNPSLRYHLATTLREAGEEKDANDEAQVAYHRNSQTPRPPRGLGDWQRFRLAQWLDLP